MNTIPQLFESSSKQFASNILLWKKNGSAYQGITYREINEMVIHIAAGLLKLGVEKGDRVVLLSEGRREWLVAELAVLYTGAVVVPISTKLTETAEILFRLTHSDSRFVFVSESQLKKVQKIASSCPELQWIVRFDKIGKPAKNELYFEDLLSEGKQHFEQNSSELNDRQTSLSTDDLACISYTSGTTSDPKGIMLSHRNYTANIEQANSLFKVPEWYVTLLILPWDHAFAHTVGLYVLIKNGASVAVVEQGKTAFETLRNIPKNIKEIKPSFLLSVPALARNFKKNIEFAVLSKGNYAEKLFYQGLHFANLYYGDTSTSPKKNFILKTRVWFYDTLIFSRIRKQFGGRLEFFIGGGALLDLELQQFFYAIGIPMYQGYGLSEAAPVISSNTPEHHKLGSSGKLVNNLELRILDENGVDLPSGQTGEIVVKGENVMKGYWKNEIATKKVLKDGWLFTGDLGYLDSDGFLYVQGRFKSLLIGNDGEKFSPEGIEESLVDNSPFIDQCMLYNNQGPYTIALIVPNKDVLKKALLNASIDPSSAEGILESLFLIRSEIDKFYSGGKLESNFPQRWLPSAIGILDEPFTEENKMINTTLKLVRSKVVSRYQAAIDNLYTSEGKKIDNELNKTAIRKMFSDSSEVIEEKEDENPIFPDEDE